jgi:hypothetical protein
MRQTEISYEIRIRVAVDAKQASRIPLYDMARSQRTSRYSKHVKFESARRLSGVSLHPATLIDVRRGSLRQSLQEHQTATGVTWFWESEWSGTHCSNRAAVTGVFSIRSVVRFAIAAREERAFCAQETITWYSQAERDLHALRRHKSSCHADLNAGIESSSDKLRKPWR